jgi:hypothetical protein
MPSPASDRYPFCGLQHTETVHWNPGLPALGGFVDVVDDADYDGSDGARIDSVDRAGR